MPPDHFVIYTSVAYEGCEEPWASYQTLDEAKAAINFGWLQKQLGGDDVYIARMNPRAVEKWRVSLLNYKPHGRWFHSRLEKGEWKGEWLDTLP